MISLEMAVIQEGELGPEVIKSKQSAPVSCDRHLSLRQRTEVAELQQPFADVSSPLPGRTSPINHHIETSQV